MCRLLEKHDKSLAGKLREVHPPSGVGRAAVGGLDLLGGACAGRCAPQGGGSAAAGPPCPPQQLGPASIILATAQVLPHPCIKPAALDLCRLNADIR